MTQFPRLRDRFLETSVPHHLRQEATTSAAQGYAPARPPATLELAECAMFLDLDGTLLEYAPHPRAAAGDAELLELLWMLTRRTYGALALVSGRSIHTVDTLLHPLQLPASGLHGFERRSSAGVLSRHPAPSPGTLTRARRLLAQVAARDPRLRFEDKEFALALHYRQAPHMKGAVVRAVGAIASAAGGELELQLGPMVAELSPCGVSKATALAEFMSERPFAGRRPVFVGDDPTDEPAFEWVNAAGGVSVAVNATHSTAAATELGCVSEVRAWLHALIRRSE